MKLKIIFAAGLAAVVLVAVIIFITKSDDSTDKESVEAAKVEAPRSRSRAEIREQMKERLEE